MIEKFSDLENYVIFCNSLSELQDLKQFIIEKGFKVYENFNTQYKDQIMFIRAGIEKLEFYISIPKFHENEYLITIEHFKSFFKDKDINTIIYKSNEYGQVTEIIDFGCPIKLYFLDIENDRCEGIEINKENRIILNDYIKKGILFKDTIYVKEYKKNIIRKNIKLEE